MSSSKKFKELDNITEKDYHIPNNKNYAEMILYIIFCIFAVIISIFHEPCFDEFQAWNISKDSIYNIMFVIPHFEGHPPFWHLILKCFSHFNINCEAGIKIPNLLFMFGAVWLLMFKSPFPRAVKLLLPFTYFIFYQYSIISRPYSIFCFAMFLAAVFYKERNEHPFRFILALALLCLSCAYGMVISTGIILAWFIQILSRVGISGYIKTFVKDKRFYAMFLIFLLCLFLSFIIYPDKNVLYNSAALNLPFFKKILYIFLILPIDALFYNFSDFSTNYIDSILNNSFTFISGCFLGIFVNLLFFFIFKSYKKLFLFYIPYLILLTAFLCVYVSIHHIGLITGFYIFIFWCLLIDKDISLKKTLKKILYCLLILTFCIQIFWSISAGIYEIIYPYSTAREISEFIKQNNLQNYKIIARWAERSAYRNKKTGKIIKIPPVIMEQQYKYLINHYEKMENLNGQNICVMINPYFNRNIFYAFNSDKPEKEYVVFKWMSLEEVEKTKQLIQNKGLPDIIIGKAAIWEFFSPNELKNAVYLPIKTFYYYKIYKNHYEKCFQEIYVKKNLYDKLKS